jgi:hypothetical protein
MKELRVTGKRENRKSLEVLFYCLLEAQLYISKSALAAANRMMSFYLLIYSNVYILKNKTVKCMI